MMTKPDVIDLLTGEALALRARRPITRDETQKSYEALFEPKEAGTFSLTERFAVAAFVAGIHRQNDAQNFYKEKLHALDAKLQTTIHDAATNAQTHGPYGSYPEGPLTGENEKGAVWKANGAPLGALGPRLTSALQHAHFLVFHPRDASRQHLDALLKAGWNQTEIVTLSQLIAFLSFQIRLVTGLKALAAQSA